MNGPNHGPSSGRTVLALGITLLLIATIVPATAQGGPLFCNDVEPGDDSCVIHCSRSGVCGSCPEGPTTGCDIYLFEDS